MLNPSTADEVDDDPTIRRCISFARREGAGALDVVNLFAFRATKPEALFDAPDPQGPMNRIEVASAATGATNAGGWVVAAWGAHWLADLPGADCAVMLRDFGVSLRCLGHTKGGAPRHPLYVKGDAPLVMYGGGK